MDEKIKRKGLTEKLLKLFSKKLSKIEKMQTYLLFLCCVLFLCQIGQGIYLKKQINKKSQEKTKIIYRSNKTVFLGDSITDQYDLKKYFNNENYINSGVGGNTTKDVLDNLQRRLLDYSPAQIVLLIGTNDKTIPKDGSVKETVDNIDAILTKIKLKLPNTKVYVQSIYPVNNTDDDKIINKMVNGRKNSNIKEVNKQIKNLCEEYEMTYIDMFDLLKDKDGNLNLDYTKEGLHINDKGYEVITKELKKYL